MTSTPSERHHSSARVAARAAATAIIMLIGIWALAGCGSAADSSSAPADSTQRDAAEPGMAAPDTAEQPGAAEEGSTADESGGTNSGSAGQPLGTTDVRAVVQTGEITVEVPDVRAAAEQIAADVIAVNGLIAADTRDSAGDDSTATIVLRVPPESFRRMVDKVADRGKEKTRQLSSEDVTDAVVDLDARIAGQQASVDRVRELLARAGSITEIAAVERELAQREQELAALQAQKRTLSAKVSYSTLTVTLLAPTAAITQASPERGFMAGLRGGWRVFLSTGNALLAAFGALLPFIVLAAVIAIATRVTFRWWRRRHPARRAQPAQPGPARQFPTTPYGMPAPQGQPMQPMQPMQPGPQGQPTPPDSPQQ